MKEKVRVNFVEFMIKVDAMKKEVERVQRGCKMRLLYNDDIDSFVRNIIERKSGKAMIRSGAVNKNYAKQYWKPTTTVVRWENGEFDVKRKLFAVKYGDDGAQHYWKEGMLEIDSEGNIDIELAREELGLV